MHRVVNQALERTLLLKPLVQYLLTLFHRIQLDSHRFLQALETFREQVVVTLDELDLHPQHILLGHAQHLGRLVVTRAHGEAVL